MTEIVDLQQREMWAVTFLPPQDAPALGYLPSQREHVGAAAVLDNSPPTVAGPPDPVADMVRAYRLTSGRP
jgi:hypothetical protein